ncbi:bifunctional 3-(3-hydroxy-phenyl)propionate/3-hydroxycinnamic acid hydroxylase [Mesorhizobium carmichaelinearum]|uniref:bifunctional 3-(3-hydroxy-phenyl)propionate/3-hydroxycinnamic acid hydroxylase n=1 Tax=Mesorhizobium carmichaelinearum TaxID=1208188 RepID=UPI000BA3C38C|nr:bifunctional 3-(3-hydroxy-phenyl)propionate/3-hydroxycinnamic acid hydroxylase [Mesorhizobium carmichaelinearum]
MNRTLPLSTDVLIVGCGPVGATLANMLAMRGVHTLVVDKAEQIYAAPRAIAFDSDALRILQSVGLTDSDFGQTVIPYVRMRSPIFGEFARVNTAREVDTHPLQITFHQPSLEAALRRKLEGQDGFARLALGVELVDLTQDAECVTVRLTSDRREPVLIQAKFVIGADGASSVVRGLIDQEFRGKSFFEDWLIIDAKNVRDPIDHVEFLCDPARPTPHMVAPDGRERWEFMLAKGETRQKMESDSEIDRLLTPWGGLAAMEIERRAVYRFHARCAGSFRKGRVFLAGDAAHITPPFVGQGLVSGLRDAANLSWKLAMVVKGHADAAILDSYNVERQPHAKAMINVARLIGKLIMPRNRAAAFVNHGAMRLMRMVPRLRGLLEDQGIRPPNLFKHGLFLQGARRGTLRPGALLPQVWLTHPVHGRRRSDDVLGPGFALVGFGVNPAAHVGPNTRSMLERIGAKCYEITWDGKREGHADHRWSALGDIFVRSRDFGTIALIRPDQVIMCCSGALSADRNIAAAFRLITGLGECAENGRCRNRVEATS